MTITISKTKDSLSSQRSLEITVIQQLALINSELETASGSEHRALEKAREELLLLIRIVDDME